MASNTAVEETRTPELEARYSRLIDMSDRLANIIAELEEFKDKLGPPATQDGADPVAKQKEGSGRTDFMYRFDAISENMEGQILHLNSLVGDLRRML